jgi:RimJ/RimL family protein N-acetyltransferase
MRATLDVLGEIGFREVTLWVLEGNDRARRFYERWRFEPDGSTKTDERFGFPISEIRYRRSLLSPLPDHR